MSINLAWPAYRVTVPACVLVATLRKKLKTERETKLKAEQAEQAEREANKTKKNVVSSYRLSRWSSCFSCFLHEKETPIKQQPKKRC